MIIFKNIVFMNWAFLPEIFLIFILPFFILFITLILSFVPNAKKNLVFANFWFNFILIIYFFLILNNLYTTAIGFNGLIHTNIFINIFKLILTVSLLFLNKFSVNSLKTDNIFKFEYYFLLSTAFLGSILTIGAGNFVTFILALELQSLSLYILIALKNNSILSLESSLKYFLLGVISSIITFIGIFFIFLYFNTLSFFELKTLNLSSEAFETLKIVWPLMTFFLFSSVFFKSAIFPFQFWAPDVYQAAQTTVVAFLATISKLTILVFVIRLLCLDVLFLDPIFWTTLTLPFLILTTIIGAFRGLIQTNLKRILAFSSMLHISFILIILFIFYTNNQNLLLGTDSQLFEGLNLTSFEKIKISVFTLAIFYLLIYIFLNLIFFALLMCLKKRTFFKREKEIKSISDLVGLSETNPLIAFIFLSTLLSLAGFPPFLGFYPKYFFILQLVEHDHWILGFFFLTLSIISTIYYIKIIRAIFFEKIQNLSDSNLNSIIVTNLVLIHIKPPFIMQSNKLFIFFISFISFFNVLGVLFFHYVYLFSFNLSLQLVLNMIV